MGFDLIVPAGDNVAGKQMDFGAWTRRIQTPPEAVKELRRLFRNAGPRLAQALRITIDGESIAFCVPQIWIADVR
jgi:hypothetical protein